MQPWEIELSIAIILSVLLKKKMFKISYGFNLLVPKPYGPVTFSTHMNKTF